MTTSVLTGGNDADAAAKAMALILSAREKLVTAQHHLSDEGRMVPVITIGAVLDLILTLMGEVGA